VGKVRRRSEDRLRFERGEVHAAGVGAREVGKCGVHQPCGVRRADRHVVGRETVKEDLAEVLLGDDAVPVHVTQTEEELGPHVGRVDPGGLAMIHREGGDELREVDVPGVVPIKHAKEGVVEDMVAGGFGVNHHRPELVPVDQSVVVAHASDPLEVGVHGLDLLGRKTGLLAEVLDLLLFGAPFEGHDGVEVRHKLRHLNPPAFVLIHGVEETFLVGRGQQHPHPLEHDMELVWIDDSIFISVVATKVFLYPLDLSG